MFPVGAAERNTEMLEPQRISTAVPCRHQRGFISQGDGGGGYLSILSFQRSIWTLILWEEAETRAPSFETQDLLENKTSTWSCTVLTILEMHFPKISHAPAYNHWSWLKVLEVKT